MTRFMFITAGLLAALGARLPLYAQEQELPKELPKYSDAKQPTKSSAPPIRGKKPLERPPRLTDGPTGEDGKPIGTVEETPAPTVRAPEFRRRDPDRVMATWIALEAHEGIVLANLARERSSSENVRKLAKGLIEDNEALLASLKPFAPDASRHDYVSTTAKEAAKDPTDVSPSVSATENRAQGPVNRKPRAAIDDHPEKPVVRATADASRDAAESRDFNVIEIERALAAQCLASSRKMLDEQRGQEFDHYFLMQQLTAQKALRDKLIVYQRYVSGSLADAFAAAERSADMHLELLSSSLAKMPEPAKAAATTRALTPAKTVKR